MITKELMNEWIEEEAIVKFGKVPEAELAIYITPEGEYISGSSKWSLENGCGERDLDYRCIGYLIDSNPYISDTFWDDAFKATKFIMVVPEHRQVVMTVTPTPEQERSISYLISRGYTSKAWN